MHRKGIRPKNWVQILVKADSISICSISILKGMHLPLLFFNYQSVNSRVWK